MTTSEQGILKGEHVYTLRRINPDKWAKVKMYQYAFDDIGPGTNKLGLPATGLTEAHKDIDSKGRTTTIPGTRTEIEKLMGLDEGSLRPGTQHKPSDFWLKFSVKVGENDLQLDTSIPDNALKVLFLKAQSQVAFGIKNIKSKSEYVLFTAEEEAVAHNVAKKGRRKATVLFDKLSESERREILSLTGIKADSLSNSVIEDKLGDFAEDYPTKFIALVEDPNRSNKMFIRECLDKGLLSYDSEGGGTIIYNETVLGYDIDSATVSLFSENNIKTLEALKLQL